jgi:AcrR family transcriptional regulator
MRVKTEGKRLAILDAAKSVFLERGYDTASMAEVAARVGGSKQTLYSYFSSKEDLFVAVMLERGPEQLGPLFEGLDPDQDFRAVITCFARAFLTFVLGDEAVSFRRVIIAEGAKTNVGKLFFEYGLKRRWTAMADYIAACIERGVIRPVDPWRATMHLQALLEAGPFQRRLEGVWDAVDADEMVATADAAVDVFLRAYAAGP